jgi:hypothetical protein
MHPVITQAVIAERSRDLQASAAAAQQAKEIRRGRRSRQAGRPWAFLHIARAGHGSKTRRAPRLMRGPGPA